MYSISEADVLEEDERSWEVLLAKFLMKRFGDTEKKMDAIHRDVRLLGDLVLSFSNRLEALEKADRGFARARDAWTQGAEDGQ